MKLLECIKRVWKDFNVCRRGIERKNVEYLSNPPINPPEKLFKLQTNFNLEGYNLTVELKYTNFEQKFKVVRVITLMGLTEIELGLHQMQSIIWQDLVDHLWENVAMTREDYDYINRKLRRDFYVELSNYTKTH